MFFVPKPKNAFLNHNIDFDLINPKSLFSLLEGHLTFFLRLRKLFDYISLVVFLHIEQQSISSLVTARDTFSFFFVFEKRTGVESDRRLLFEKVRNCTHYLEGSVP